MAKWSVYLIADGHGYHKIGLSVNPERRVKDMQTGQAKPLRLVSSAGLTGVEDIRQAERIEAWVREKALQEAAADPMEGEWLSFKDQAGVRSWFIHSTYLFEMPRLYFEHPDDPAFDPPELDKATALDVYHDLTGRDDLIEFGVWAYQDEEVLYG